jgi:hypothetical protein
MSTLIFGDDATVFSALQRAFLRAVQDSRIVMVTTFSNSCPVPGVATEQQKARMEAET